MKNKIVAKVLGNATISKVVGKMGMFYISHESTILTGGTMGLSAATTWITYENSPKIHNVLMEAREALWNCNTEEEKKQVYKLALKELIPLVAPIFLLQGATFGCAAFSKRQADRKLAEAAGALAIVQSAIAQYQSFQKEAEEALGEEKYEKLQKDIYSKKDIDGRRFTAIASEGAPGETLFIDKYSGRPFWCNYERIKFAAERISNKLYKGGGWYDDQVTINEYYKEIQNPDLTPNLLGDKFGYLSKVEETEVIPKFVDTHFIFPNGTRVQAAEVYLYPEPDYVG